MIKAVSPFASPDSGAVSKNGTIAYSSVSWTDNPAGLTTSYLNKLNNAVAPARKAGLEVQYGGGAGPDRPADERHRVRDHRPGLRPVDAAVHVRLVHHRSDPAGVRDLQRGRGPVGGRPARLDRPPSRRTAPTVATLLGLGVAVDYGLFLTARHREQLDSGMDVVTSASRAEGTSGAAIVIAGSTVVVAILGLYLSGVPFVGSMGLAAAIVVAITMAAALTLVPSFMGLVKNNVRSLRGARPRAPGRHLRAAAGQANRRGHRGPP